MDEIDHCADSNDNGNKRTTSSNYSSNYSSSNSNSNSSSNNNNNNNANNNMSIVGPLALAAEAAAVAEGCLVAALHQVGVAALEQSQADDALRCFDSVLANLGNRAKDDEEMLDKDAVDTDDCCHGHDSLQQQCGEEQPRHPHRQASPRQAKKQRTSAAPLSLPPPPSSPSSTAGIKHGADSTSGGNRTNRASMAYQAQQPQQRDNNNNNNNMDTPATTLTSTSTSTSRNDTGTTVATSYIYQRVVYDEGMNLYGPAAYPLHCTQHAAKAAVVLYNKGIALSQRGGNDPAAIRCFQQALRAVLVCAGAVTTAAPVLHTHLTVVAVQHNIGCLLYRASRLDEALRTFREALQHSVTLFGRDSQEVALSLNCIGVLYFHQADTGSDTALT